MLCAYDVDHVFFVPTILSHALYEMESMDVTRIVGHSERAAVYMADGYARATRKPGICLGQAVGAAEIAASLREPFLACSPVIALTGGPTAHNHSRQSYQQVNDFPMFEPVTKFNGRALSLDRVPDLIRQAFRVATSGKPGPSHLQLLGPQGEELETAESDVEVYGETVYGEVPPHRPRADPESVAAVVGLIRRADRPVFVAGGGARWSDAGAVLVELAERLQIPVATALNAKALISGDHPLAVGVPGLYARPSANRVVSDADLVIFIGSQTGSQATNGWTVPSPGTRVVQIDLDASELGRHYPNSASLLGDARSVLAQILETLGPEDVPHHEWAATARGHVERWHSETASVRESDDQPMRPERLMQELSRCLADDALVVADTGHAGIWTGAWMDLGPRQGYLRAAGNLGWALPAGIGAALGATQRPVVVITGDGGLWYHLSELETAVRWNIPVVFVVNDNRSLNQEINPYTRAYGNKLSGRHHELWHFTNVDLAQLANDIGAIGIRVTEPGQIEPALARAVGAGRPVLVDAVTDRDVIAPGVRY